MKKTHYKTFFYIFPILTILMTGMSCFGPMDLTPFFNDPKVQDLIGGGGIVIDYEPPADLTPIIQWGPPPYTNMTLINKGDTINIAMGASITISFQNQSLYSNHSWLLDSATLPFATLSYIDILPWAAPFDIVPPAVYHISLVTYREGKPYSTYFTLRIN